MHVDMSVVNLDMVILRLQRHGSETTPYGRSAWCFVEACATWRTGDDTNKCADTMTLNVSCVCGVECLLATLKAFAWKKSCCMECALPLEPWGFLSRRKGIDFLRHQAQLQSSGSGQRWNRCPLRLRWRLHVRHCQEVHERTRAAPSARSR